VIFAPDSWTHAVLNLAESVGYALEFILAAKSIRPVGDTGSAAGDAGGVGSGGGYDRVELLGQRIKALRTILKERFDGHVCEQCKWKDEFVDRILQLAAAAAAASAGGGGKAEKDEL
jgi:hypothetical protein